MVNKQIKSIGIFSTTYNRRIEEIVLQCCEIILNKGIEVTISSNLKKLKNKKLIKLSSDEDIIKRSDLLLAIGGDGTILSSSRIYGFKGVPILGINLGNLGFLADIDPKNLAETLTDVLEGQYATDERIFLEARSNKGSSNKALNEIVVHSGAVAKLMEYTLEIDNKFVFRQKADGIIICTPTGSTAYSLSGGGPIIHPHVNTILLLPMLPHSLTARPLIVSDNSKIEIKIEGRTKKANVNFDGQESFVINKETNLKINKSKKVLNLVHPISHDFYSASRNKLGWSAETQ
tara:strand:+ start:1081 stop:1950 length:870 start_codon:yes stop_codon:yes gene_type:complete